MVFENQNGHRTRLAMEFFHSKLYKQAYATYSELKATCGGLEFALLLKDAPELQVNGLFKLYDAVIDEASYNFV